MVELIEKRALIQIEKRAVTIQVDIKGKQILHNETNKRKIYNKSLNNNNSKST